MSIEQIAQQARQACRSLALATTQDKQDVLHAFATALIAQTESLLTQNQLDLSAATDAGKDAAFIDRLKLTADRIKAMAEGVRTIADGPDPVGQILAEWQQPSGLQIQRVSVPIGVIAIIYESRPNVTADAAALCIQSGNASILRGGKESFHSAQAIFQILHKILIDSSLPEHAVQMLPDTDRQSIDTLIQQEDNIDVVIPRGGKALVTYLSTHSRIPLFKHLAGLCHTYVHQDADIEKAIAICLNAKMRRPGICGATETILIDAVIADNVAPKLLQTLHNSGCQVRGDTRIQTYADWVQPANQEDWETEYLAPTVAMKVVSDCAEAIAHVQQYSSQHTDAIITEDAATAARFMQEIDSAIVMQNTSTQFADGGEFGMGAEIGIATGKLHARGPVGVQQLNTFKYCVCSQGACRA